MDDHPGDLRDPFSNSAAVSLQPSPVLPNPYPRNKRLLRSYLLNGEYEKPWINDKRFNRIPVGNYIIYSFFIVALILSAFFNYAESLKVHKYPYCLILDDQFSSLDSSAWNVEVQIDGFGNGAFDWTTADHTNYFADSEGLHILPTLTNESTSITNAEIYNGYTLDLSKRGGDGTCTGTTKEECVIRSSRPMKTIIPPVRSARINTKGKKSIRYGRVEVVARLPRGDWLWPAIWMMPVNDTYGPWPASGEIDIMESRGNGINYPLGGRNTMSSTLHWGPAPGIDAFWKTTGNRPMIRGDYSEDFHTFGLVWSEREIYSYVDNPLQRVLVTEFPKNGEDMWKRGDFAGDIYNSSLVVNPWSQTGRSNTPFDQPFYLILDVAVGGTNGYFPDGVGGKPWVNSGPAALEFYKDVDKWFRTWPSGKQLAHRGMTIKSVKMWQQGTCH